MAFNFGRVDGEGSERRTCRLCQERQNFRGQNEKSHGLYRHQVRFESMILTEQFLDYSHFSIQFVFPKGHTQWE